MKKNRKSFTLVELLVVIAILAILATVSILGYTSFTGKAKASNAEQELSQMKTMFLTDWLDGFVGDPIEQHSMVKNDNDYTATFTFVDYQNLTSDIIVNDDLKEEITKRLLKALDKSDVGSLINNVSFTYSLEAPQLLGTTLQKRTIKATVVITEVKYKCSNGYTATWSIKDDTINAVPTTQE